jgi:hypothetical protein
MILKVTEPNQYARLCFFREFTVATRVGTSTNGAGAFGASLNMLTDSYSKKVMEKSLILWEF